MQIFFLLLFRFVSVRPVLCSNEDVAGGNFGALGGGGAVFGAAMEMLPNGVLQNTTADGIEDDLAASSAPHANGYEGKRKALYIAAAVTALLGILILMRHHAYAWYTRHVYLRFLKSADMSKDAMQHVGGIIFKDNFVARRASHTRPLRRMSAVIQESAAIIQESAATIASMPQNVAMHMVDVAKGTVAGSWYAGYGHQRFRASGVRRCSQSGSGDQPHPEGRQGNLGNLNGNGLGGASGPF